MKRSTVDRSKSILCLAMVVATTLPYSSAQACVYSPPADCTLHGEGTVNDARFADAPVAMTLQGSMNVRLHGDRAYVDGLRPLEYTAEAPASGVELFAREAVKVGLIVLAPGAPIRAVSVTDAWSVRVRVQGAGIEDVELELPCSGIVLHPDSSTPDPHSLNVAPDPSAEQLVSKRRTLQLFASETDAGGALTVTMRSRSRADYGRLAVVERSNGRVHVQLSIAHGAVIDGWVRARDVIRAPPIVPRSSLRWITGRSASRVRYLAFSTRRQAVLRSSS